MMPRSIRWRLPLTYAGIALLTAVSLSALLLTTLHIYYQQRERDYLTRNAQVISASVASLVAAGRHEELRAHVEQLASLVQARLRLLGRDGQVLVDSGVPDRPRPLVPPLPPLGGRERPAASGLSPVPPRPPLVLDASGPFFDPELAESGRSEERVAVPLLHPSGTQLIGYVELSQGLPYGRGILTSVAQVGAMAGLVAVMLAAGAGWLVSRRLTAPLLDLTSVTARMAAGDLSARAELTRPDEIGLLARSYNQMARRVEETVVTLKSFIADAAHELHTPLTALRTNLDLAVDEDDSAQRRAFVERARAEVQRLEELTSDLLDLSRLEAGSLPEQHAPIDLSALIQAMSETYASRAEQAGLSFELDVPAAPVTITGNEAHVRRALGNVLDNAIKFTPDGGTVDVWVHRDAEWVTVAVTDSGIGIPPADLPNVFNRFHRGRNAAAYAGSGLGLAIVRAIMQRHGGRVLAENTASGARFSLSWPAVDP